jgi:hypothetical protein
VPVTGGVYITGLKELRRDFQKFSPELQKLMGLELTRVVAGVLVPDIQAKIPMSDKRKRHARETVRAVAFQGGVGIRAGSAAVPYYGWLDFGGDLPGRGRGRDQTISRPFYREGRYIYPTIAEDSDDLTAAALKATDDMIRAFNAGGATAVAQLLRR